MDVAVDLFNQHLFEHQSLFERLGPMRPMVSRAADCIARRLNLGGKLLLCGNGGSAADCQHLAAEFVGRFVHDRRALAAIALTVDSSALTCIGNDFGFDQVFARQVEGIGRAGDVLIGITTSGNSANVLRALQATRSMGIRTVGLLGRDGGACAALCDVPLIVPSDITARIQEAHIFLGHLICAEVESRMGF
jgi:D-sedoheptulose 7-phosphate isomerase